MHADPLSATFAALADPTRRAILARLATGEATVTELAAPFDMSLPGVSKHLKVLREAELVTVREDGQRRFYSLAVEPLEVIDDWLVPFLVDPFGDSAPDLDAYPLPEPAAHAAEAVGRAAASAKHAVAAALKRFGA
jgi:DNA-binding transcriptional ArsR family regulator